MAAPGHDVILVRHGELGLKSPHLRARLERTLTRRIEEALARDGVESLVRRVYSRHLVEASDQAAAMRSLSRVFGVTTFSPATHAPAAMEELKAATAAYARTYWPDGARSFAIRARRTGTHPYTSRDVAVQAGSAVWQAMQAEGIEISVDLDKPDFALHIEVRNKDAFLHHERYPGPGGLPLGTQGRVALWISGSDAAAAAYLMLRRGAEIVPYALIEPQHAAAGGPHPAHAVMTELERWGATGRLHIIPSPVSVATPQDDAAASADAFVAFARAAIATGLQLARERRAHALVTAETRNVPWAARLPETHPGGEIPVLRPLMGLERAIIDDFREVVGLKRRGAGRSTETARAYTAGGRGLGATYASARSVTRTTAEDPWDPW